MGGQLALSAREEAVALLIVLANEEDVGCVATGPQVGVAPPPGEKGVVAAELVVVALSRQYRRRARQPRPPPATTRALGPAQKPAPLMPAAAGAPGATAACGQSEDSAGHTPLPKRAPHLCKRPPLAHPAAGPPRPPGGFARGRTRRRLAGARGAAAPLGRAAAQAPRARACTTPDGRGIADTRPATAPSRPATHPRADTTEPSEPPPTPDPAFRLLLLPPPPRPGRFPPRRLDCSPTGSHNTHQPTHHTLPLPRCRRPAPGPLAPAWADPSRFYLDGRGRGASATRWPPFLESPGGKRKTGRGRGGGPFALKTNP